MGMKITAMLRIMKVKLFNSRNVIKCNGIKTILNISNSKDFLTLLCYEEIRYNNDNYQLGTLEPHGFGWQLIRCEDLYLLLSLSKSQFSFM